MSFVGKIEDVPFPELLQFISYNGKTGKLTLTRRGGHGVVVFRQGRVIYAASNSVRETLGNILVCRGLIDEPTLVEALERQHWSPEGKRLGTVLMEMGKVRRGDLEDVMRQQTGEVLQELIQWHGGFFKFETLEFPARGEIEVDAKEFVVMEGLNTERLLLDVAKRLDEKRAEVLESDVSTPASHSGSRTPASGPAPAEDSTLSLLSAMSEPQSPALRGEITLKLMRYATDVVNRGVLLIVRGNEIGGMGHFGIGGGVRAESAIRELRLPLGEPSVFSEVVEMKASYRGPLRRTPVNDRFAARLGGVGGDVVVIPMLVGDSVAMAFYGDNLPETRLVGPTGGLERVIAEVGLAIEKEALEARIRRFEAGGGSEKR